MPSKYQMYKQMADEAARQITGSYQGWTGFLTTAARLYKYPYNEQLMIHTQRPDATACAEYDFWNEKMGRYVRRGSKGIALIDASGDSPKLRYVFDVSDTGGREYSRAVQLWQLRDEHVGSVSAMLEEQYEVSGENGLAQQLESVASQLAREYWNDHGRNFLHNIDGSFLEEYDDFNIGAQFRNAATVSITYALMSRCGLEPEEYFTHEDFLAVFDFNTTATSAALGTAVSEMNQQVLRQIGVVIRNYEYERSQQNERTDLHEERRLLDSRPETERGTGAEVPGQVREDAQSLPEGTPPDPLESNAPVGEPVSPPAGDRRDGKPAARADDAVADGIGGRDGESKRDRSHEVDGPDEQLQGAGGGNHSERADLQLTPAEPEQQANSDALVERVPVVQLTDSQPVQLSLFPTEAEQIAYIDAAESEQASLSAFSMSIPQEDIDHILRIGGNTDHARMKIVTEFSKGKSPSELAQYLHSIFHGGNGVITGNGRYSAWYAEDGIHISGGDAARYLLSAKVVSWQEAAERTGQLLEDGAFATNVELAEASGHERIQIAQSLWYLYHDFSESAIEAGYLPSITDFRGGGFPEETEKLANALADPAYRETLTAEYRNFLAAWQENKALLRFRYHKPAELLNRLEELSLPRREYLSDMAQVPETGSFITEDEIAESLSHGSGIEGGKGRIYAFFQENHTVKEQADMLKQEYGIGGRSHAVSGATHSGEDQDSKGIALKKENCPDIQLNWNNAAKRISDLIHRNRYLTPKEQELYEQRRSHDTARDTIYGAYTGIKEAHPEDVVLFQVGDFFEMYGEDARQAAELLNLHLTTRNIPDVGRVAMCGIPAHSLEQHVEKLRDNHDVTISAVNEAGERRSYSMLSIDHEAEKAVNAHEAEYGADGFRAFPSDAPNQVQAEPQSSVHELYARYKPVVLTAVSEDTFYRNACGHSDRENAGIECNAAVRRAVLQSGNMELIRLFSDEPELRRRLHQEVFDETYPRLHELLRPLSQEDIDEALRSWNGNFASKQAVVRYMADHAKERDTAAWLSREYGGDASKNLFIVRAGSPETVELTWPKVQRRIAQLIQEDRFYTDQELDNFADIDPIAIREALNSPEAQTRADEMLAQAELVAAESAVPTYERFSVAEIDRGFQSAYAIWDDLRDGYYVDDDGVTEEFISEWQAEDYLKELQRTVSERESAEWAYVESSKVQAEKITDEMDMDTVLDEAPVSVVIDGEVKTFPNAHALEEYEANREDASFPYSVGDTVYLEDGKPFVIENIGMFDISLRDPSLLYPIFRAESKESFTRLMERYPQPEKQPVQPTQEAKEPQFTTETVAVYPAEQNKLPYDVVIQTIRTDEPDPPASNFRITDEHLGEGGAKAKFRMNMDAINLLKELEFESRQATPDEQEVLSKYVGWGGLADAFDESKPGWANEFAELYATLTPEEYAAARASTLNAHYTSPTVIRAIYEAVEQMGFQSGNILEPAMGVGNFFGLLPDSMAGSKLYGVELDSITGRIAKQLYPGADITVAGFETTDRRDFYDLVIGNVPFGQYQVNDRAYNKLGFSIHDYFFAKSLDQLRPGGVLAFVTSRYTMDKQSPEVRKYLAQRAEFLGAIRLPNNAFKANAGTEVVSDIIFLQKRDRPIEIDADWMHLGQSKNGFAINSYFAQHPEMVLGIPSSESTQYGRQDYTVAPFEDADLGSLLHEAVGKIGGRYTEAELPELGENESIDTSIPADPNVKNYSYTIVDGEVYYRVNSRMVKPELSAIAKERVRGMVELRDCVQKLIGQQMDGFISDAEIQRTQRELNTIYDAFTAKYGLINARANSLAFSDDSSYFLLCSLEVLDEENNLKRKADMFTKRTIRPHEAVTSVDTASEALALSIAEKACVDMEYMSSLANKPQDELIDELTGVIFLDPIRQEWQTADEYLSGDVRQKLREAQREAVDSPGFLPNVEALLKAQPKDLDASEIEVRLGATWIDKDYIRQFMFELFEPAFYARRSIDVNYSEYTAEWNITGKSAVGYGDINAYMTYGTDRANAYKILEDTLNLRDVRIYDTKTDADGKEKRVLNSKETTLAQQKQQAIKDAFQEWIWKDPDRRQTLVQKYNELFNSNRPREYDGQHITFSGMNPEIQLREHQLNAVAHVLYGGNTLLAHEVGAGKTFEMVAAAMESKRLGLCQKSLFVVPNHLTEQWASEFLRLYPSANILVATRKDFETRNRKKFCGRIATGDYDAVIIGHSQFERIPVSKERQERLLQEQLFEVEEGLEELKASRAERFTIKSLEKTKKSLEVKLQKLQDSSRKDDVITFEQLGVDRLYVDEAHSFKNLFLYTKMRNVAGLSTTDAQKSSDMLMKCRYIDEITGSRGVVFATGTPVSNSMTELYTMMRYLQHSTIQKKRLAHFDCWASTFGETTTAIELAPEGTGYRARTRFAKFFNLPELMKLFKEAADIKTADQLNLPTPTPIYHTEVAQPTEIQKGMVQELSERAAKVHAGLVDASMDNMLKITSDGRKLGLDQRIINPDLPDDPTSKVNMCVDNIVSIWENGQADKLTQLVFCDLSTPKTTGTAKAAKSAAGNLDSPELHALEQMIDKETPDEPAFTIYDDIRKKLVARGIPREQIAFIHEANTETRKKDLFAKVRSGQVRVLMGSTFKMGAGMNVQDRLVALHDLDCPWRPGDLEQRSGRIIRQGNQNKEVHIYRYVTEGTFDAYLWQTVENKQKFISQIMTSKSPVRSCEDIDEAALSYAEIKALCAGDERIKEKMDLDVDVARLKLMKASHQSQQYRLEDNLLKTFPEQIEKNKGFVSGFEADLKTLSEHPHPQDGFAGMVVKSDQLIDKDNAGAALLEAFKEVKGLEPVPIGSYRGFQMSLTLEDFGKEYVLTLKGQMTHRVTLGKDARGNLTRIDNALNAMPERLQAVRDKLDSLYAQMETAKTEIGKPFPQEEELRIKSARLAELNAELNIDDRTPMERLAEESGISAKVERPSILAKLKAPPMQQIKESKPRHKEQEAR